MRHDRNGLTRSARFGMKEFINREVAPFLRKPKLMRVVVVQQFNPPRRPAVELGERHRCAWDEKT